MAHDLDFLEARRELLAAETNRRLAALLHGDLQWLEGAAKPAVSARLWCLSAAASRVAKEAELETLHDWAEAQRLPRGVLAFDFADAVSGAQKAIFALAWPDGILEALSQPVAVLLNEHTDTLALASRAGFRCFTTGVDFRDYVQREILAHEDSQHAVAAVAQSV